MPELAVADFAETAINATRLLFVVLFQHIKKRLAVLQGGFFIRGNPLFLCVRDVVGIVAQKIGPRRSGALIVAYGISGPESPVRGSQRPRLAPTGGTCVAPYDLPAPMRPVFLLPRRVAQYSTTRGGTWSIVGL